MMNDIKERRIFQPSDEKGKITVMAASKNKIAVVYYLASKFEKDGIYNEKRSMRL